MTDNVVASDQWSQLVFYPEWNTLELKYLPSTGDATDGDVQKTLERFCAEAEKRKPSALILDATEFHHQWDQGMEEWSHENIIPGVNRPASPRSPSSPGQAIRDQPWRWARSPHLMGRQISRLARFPPGKGHTHG